MVKPLVSDITYPIAQLSGDGAYDQVKVYDELERRRIVPVIPPRSNAVRQIGYHRRSKAKQLCSVGR